MCTRKPDDLAVRVEREFGVRDVIAAVRVGQEGFGALGRPFDRPVDLLGRPGADRLLGVDEDLRAEPAADVGRDDAQLVLGREAHERGQHEPRDMRVLARRVERDRVGPRIVVAERRARLHRVGDQAVVDEVELGHVRRRGEGRVGRGLVAEVPVEDGVVGRERRALAAGRAWRRSPCRRPPAARRSRPRSSPPRPGPAHRCRR